ncbi:MAG: CCA tRNA nucleotidyltransferase [Thermoplasmata archaeon]|nr:MAG: CCA tRNA nucleotidyltransferase [Thermoplasmata archaeon]
MDIEEEVLVRIMPGADENKRIAEVVEKVKVNILESAGTLGVEVEPLLVGSVAKDTHLSNPDIDIFVLFPPSTRRDELERYGLDIGKAVLDDFEERYAEHPYVRGTLDELSVEIVPCFRIEDPSQRMSAVDRTPFHTAYVINHQNEGHKDQIRLLKQFLKGIGIYGAEAEVEGFSGYLCELLILYYGNFRNVVLNAKDWKKGTVIAFNEMAHGEFNESLVVIDPVDPGRNVASALSEENFALFIHACMEYHDNPKLEFFFPGDIVPENLEDLRQKLEERGTCVLGISFPAPKTLSDILHSQLRKAVRAIGKVCHMYGFGIIGSMYFVDRGVLMLFEFEIFSLPTIKSHKGPPVWHPNAFDFREKWIAHEKVSSGPYIKNGNWYVDIEREFTNAKELIEAKLTSLNLGRHINQSIMEGYGILVNDELVQERFAPWLTVFFNKKFRWEY